MNVRSYQNFALVGISVTGVGIAMAMVQYKVPTILTALMAEFDLDATGGSWLMSIFTLVMVFAAIPSGALAQRSGARRVVALASSLIVLGSVVGAFAGSGAVLLVSRAIEGAAITAMTTCGPVIIESSVDPRRAGSAMGIWGVWGPLGSSIAGLLTPTLFVLFGMTWLWLLYAAVVAVACIIMLVLVKPNGEGESPRPETDLSGLARPRYRDVFTRDAVLFYAGFAGFNVCLLAVLSYVPTILQGQGMDATLSGFASTLPMLLSIVSSPFFGALSDKTGKTKQLLVLTVAFLGPCAFLMYTQSGAVLWTAAVVMGLIGMGSSGLMISGFMRVLPDPSLKTIGMGVFITVQGIGQFLGTFLVQTLLGPAMDRVALAGTVVMVLGLLGAMCLALARYRS